MSPPSQQPALTPAAPRSGGRPPLAPVPTMPSAIASARAMIGGEAAPTPPSGGRTGRRKLGELLIADGLITEEQLHDALASRMLRAGRRERLGETIVRMGYADDDDIAAALAVQLALDTVRAEDLRPDEAAMSAVPGPLAQRLGVLPLRLEGTTLILAAADPTDFVAFDDIRVATGGRAVKVVVAPSAALARAIERAYKFGQGNAGELLSSLGTFASEALAESVPEAGSVDDAPVVRLAEGIISAALQERASDIHVEPTATATVVRYRIDGVLQQRMTVPLGAAPALASRLKLIAGMDIAERRRPQDGRARVNAGGQELDLRVSSMPSMFGESVVLRLLRKDAGRLRLSEVGLSVDEYAAVRAAIDRPQGLVLIAGPTGSGKTSTLYAALGELAGEERKVITLEDPIEYQLDGVNQTQINDRIGLTFARCLRTVLRQDPDVVMVGEIRDAETAELALQAALTGHLVFSTLHTNDAPGAITRLADLGIPPYLLAGAVTLVIAQRLARATCADCAKPEEAPSAEVAARLSLHPRALEGARLLRGRGCVTCSDSGYRGRTGLFELMRFDATIRRLVAAEASEAAIRRAARRGGMATLREDGLRHVREGQTTLDEVLRVAPVDEHAGDTCPSCAGLVEDGFACCPWCGSALGATACGGCTRPLERGWSWCPGCGAPTGGGDAETRDTGS